MNEKNENNEQVFATIATVASVGLALFKAYKAIRGNQPAASGTVPYPATPAGGDGQASGPKVDPNIMLNMAARHMGRMTDITNNGFN